MCWLLTRKLPVNSCELIGGVGQDQHMSMRFHECECSAYSFAKLLLICLQTDPTHAVGTDSASIYKLQLNGKLNTFNCLENNAGHTPSNL